MRRSKHHQNLHRLITAADPQPDANGGCAQCGGPRPKPTRSRHGGSHPLQSEAPNTVKRNYEALAAAKADPFCSTACCRAWYGVEGAPPETRRKKSVLPYRGSARAADYDAREQLLLQKVAANPA